MHVYTYACSVAGTRETNYDRDADYPPRSPGWSLISRVMRCKFSQQNIFDQLEVVENHLHALGIRNSNLGQVVRIDWDGS